MKQKWRSCLACVSYNWWQQEREHLGCESKMCEVEKQSKWKRGARGLNKYLIPSELTECFKLATRLVVFECELSLPLLYNIHPLSLVYSCNKIQFYVTSNYRGNIIVVHLALGLCFACLQCKCHTAQKKRTPVHNALCTIAKCWNRYCNVLIRQQWLNQRQHFTK